MDTEFRFAPGDVTAGENPVKAAEALVRFVPEVVSDPAVFDEGYRLLEAQFGPANEIERREVLQAWFEQGSLSPPDADVRAHYRMLLLRDSDGRIAAVRDCFTALDATRAITLMSHSLVLPEWRRTGVGALVRASPVGLSRLAAAQQGQVPSEILLVCEMEHVAPHDLRTLVRLLAYTRAGLKIIPPWHVPYGQPDFRDVAALGIRPVPLPFMLLVRQVGEEHLDRIGWDRVAAICHAFGAIHGPSVHPSQRPEIVATMLQHRDPAPGASVPLLSPDVRKFEDVAPLLGSALAPHYPPAWYVDDPPADPAADRAALAEALRSFP